MTTKLTQKKAHSEPEFAGEETIEHCIADNLNHIYVLRHMTIGFLNEFQQGPGNLNHTREGNHTLPTLPDFFDLKITGANMLTETQSECMRHSGQDITIAQLPKQSYMTTEKCSNHETRQKTNASHAATTHRIA